LPVQNLGGEKTLESKGLPMKRRDKRNMTSFRKSAVRQGGGACLTAVPWIP